MSMPPQTSSTFHSSYFDEYQRHSYQVHPVKYYYPQQWPQSHPRPTSDEHASAPYDDSHYHSDPRSLSSDTTMTTSMSPVSSQDESVALPAAAVLPSKTIKSGSTSNSRRSDNSGNGMAVDAHNPCNCDWQEQARQREMEWGNVKNTLVRQDAVVSSVTSNGSPHRAPGRHRVSMCTESDEEEDENDDDDKGRENAFLVLLRISFLAPPFTLFAALYTFFALAFLVITSPLRLCCSSILKTTVNFSTQTLHLLVPLFHRHQRLITTRTASQSRRERHPYHTDTSDTSYSPAMLIVIHLLSPILILPILFASWIAAFFWVFAMILGNPDGTERRDDGRAAVLGVRNWWRIWLAKAERKSQKKSNEPEMSTVSNPNTTSRVV